MPATWALNESHFSCEQPLILNYVLRNLWHSQAFIGSDYPATHSTSGILQGEDQEMPTQTGFFSAANTPTPRRPTRPAAPARTRPARPVLSCSTAGALHVGGIPAPAARSAAARWSTR